MIVPNATVSRYLGSSVLLIEVAFAGLLRQAFATSADEAREKRDWMILEMRRDWEWGRP